MEKILDEYLTKFQKYLKPIVVSERMDIVKEMKSEIQELQNNGISAEQIIERLGNPKELAKSYLGDLLSKESGFSWNRFLTICAFYSLVGFSGMVVIPCLAMIAPIFIVFGIAAPILGAVKMMDYAFNLHLPYVANIQIVLGGITKLNPIVEFIVTLVIGVLLYHVGHSAWKMLVSYCKKVSKTKNKLSI